MHESCKLKEQVKDQLLLFTCDRKRKCFTTAEVPIADGNILQVVRPKGGIDTIRSGDSILAPHRHTFIQAEPHAQDRTASDTANQNAWNMASLTFLLPKDSRHSGRQHCTPSITLCLFTSEVLPLTRDPFGQAPHFPSPWLGLVMIKGNLCIWADPQPIAGPINEIPLPAGDREEPVDHLSAESAARIVAGAGRSAQATAPPAVEGEKKKQEDARWLLRPIIVLPREDVYSLAKQMYRYVPNSLTFFLSMTYVSRQAGRLRTRKAEALPARSLLQERPHGIQEKPRLCCCSKSFEVSHCKAFLRAQVELWHHFLRSLQKRQFLQASSHPPHLLSGCLRHQSRIHKVKHNCMSRVQCISVRTLLGLPTSKRYESNNTEQQVETFESVQCQAAQTCKILVRLGEMCPALIIC